MIGNDVVDLALAAVQSNWQRPNYLQKICTPLEINAIANAVNPNAMLWKIWSRKEAVFKILLQMGFPNGYYPKKIVCLDFKPTGKVQFENLVFHTKTKSSNKYIYTIALQNIKYLEKCKIPFGKYQVVKKNTIPFLIQNNIKYAYSKSHHGNYEKEVFLDF